MNETQTQEKRAPGGTCARLCSEVAWQTAALEILDALRAMSAFYVDLAKSNPGFMGRLCLQDYGLWNEAMIKKSNVLRKYGDLPNTPNSCSIPNRELLLGQALLNVLVATGMLSEDAAPTGPELLIFAEQFCEKGTR